MFESLAKWESAETRNSAVARRRCLYGLSVKFDLPSSSFPVLELLNSEKYNFRFIWPYNIDYTNSITKTTEPVD